MKRKCLLVVLVLVLVLLAAGCSGSTGNSEGTKSSDSQAKVEKKEEVKFPTKTLRFILPVSPGGGMDTAVRLLSKHWEKYLGGSITVENIPGGEYGNGIYAMLKEKPDGHTVIALPGVVANQLYGGVSYDLNKFEWIGRISSAAQLAVASKQSGVKSLDDLKKLSKVKAAVTGLSSSQTIGQLLSAKEMGFTVGPIVHKGVTEAVLAVIRGDGDWTSAPETTMLPYVKNGDVVPLWLAADKRSKDLPDVPTLAELGYPKVTQVVAFNRIVATNPDTPPEILEKLRESFKKALEDPEYIAEATKASDPPDFLSGEKTAQLVKESLEAIKPNVDYLKSFK